MQLAAVTFVTYEAGIRMTGKHQLNYGFAMLYDSRGMGVDHHFRSDRGDARGQQTSCSLVFDQADTASAH